MNKDKSIYRNLSPEECINLYKKIIKSGKMKSISILIIMFCVTLGMTVITGKYQINILGMFLAIIVFFMYKGMGFKAFEELKSIYFVDCDPEKWLKVLDLLLSENPDERLHNTFCMYRADVYFGLGDYEKMRRNLSDMKDEKMDVTTEMSRIALWENYFFEIGDEKGMNFCLKEFQKIKNERKIPKRLLGAMHEMEDIRNLHRSILKKDWEETIRISEKRMDTSIPAMKISYKYYMGKAYKALGEDEKANTLLREVISDGGTLNVAALAKEMAESEPLS